MQTHLKLLGYEAKLQNFPERTAFLAKDIVLRLGITPPPYQSERPTGWKDMTFDVIVNLEKKLNALKIIALYVMKYRYWYKSNEFHIYLTTVMFP